MTQSERKSIELPRWALIWNSSSPPSLKSKEGVNRHHPFKRQINPQCLQRFLEKTVAREPQGDKPGFVKWAQSQGCVGSHRCSSGTQGLRCQINAQTRPELQRCEDNGKGEAVNSTPVPA